MRVSRVQDIVLLAWHSDMMQVVISVTVYDGCIT